MKIDLENSLKSSNLKEIDLNKTCLLLQEQLITLNSDLQLYQDEKNILVQRNVTLETDVDHLKAELAESNTKIELCNVVVSEKEKESAELLKTIQTLKSDRSYLQTSVDSQVIFWQHCFCN